MTGYRTLARGEGLSAAYGGLPRVEGGSGALKQSPAAYGRLKGTPTAATGDRGTEFPSSATNRVPAGFRA